MRTGKTSDRLCAPREAASSIAFTMVLDVVERVDGRRWFRSERQDESLAELGGYGIVADKDGKRVGADVFEAADVGIAGCCWCA